MFIPKNWIFCDYDGCLANTKPITMGIGTYGLFCRFIQDRGKDVPEELTSERFIAKYYGWKFRDMLSHITEELGLDADHNLREHYVQQELAAVISSVRQHLSPAKWSLEFLRWAADAKFGLAVVTSNHADLIGAALEATGQIEHLPLTRLYSSYSSLNPPQLKPHPAVYRLALQDTGANAKKTVAIEDAPSGAMSSSGAEIFTFGLTQHIPKSVQATEERRLLDAGAQQLISNWQSMISAVKNHFFIP